MVRPKVEFGKSISGFWRILTADFHRVLQIYRTSPLKGAGNLARLGADYVVNPRLRGMFLA
jgi:hypothetical protein